MAVKRSIFAGSPSLSVSRSGCYPLQIVSEELEEETVPQEAVNAGPDPRRNS
jgi:hypothetical protein